MCIKLVFTNDAITPLCSTSYYCAYSMLICSRFFPLQIEVCLKFNIVTYFCPLCYRFAKTSVSSTSSASLSASPSPLQGSLHNILDSSGDTFADASDHFPSPDGGGLSAVAHALKYTEPADSVAKDVEAGTTAQARGREVYIILYENAQPPGEEYM